MKKTQSGIINDFANYPAIDAATIVQANEFGGETKSIFIGVFAIVIIELFN